MKNIMTDVMERTYEKLKDFDNHMKSSVTEPYGVRKLTEREQFGEYKNLTPDKLIELIQTQGLEKTNKWLYRMEQKEARYGRM